MINLPAVLSTDNCPGGGNDCCSDKTKRLLGTTECIDQVKAQPRFIFEIRRAPTRSTLDYNEAHNLVNRMTQLCGATEVPTELGGTRVVRRKRSVNATSRIIPIHQSFESSSGQIENTNLAFGKKNKQTLTRKKLQYITIIIPIWKLLR